MSANQSLKVVSCRPHKNDYEVTIGNINYILSEETVIKYRLVKDKEIENLEAILQFNEYSLSYIKIMNYVIKYPNSKYGYFLKLKTKYSESVLKQALDDLEAKGLIDEEKYANFYVNSLQKRGYGPTYIAQALKEKHLVISEELKVNEDALAEEITKYLGKNTKLDQTKLKIKAMNHFLRKGYPYADIKKYLN